MQRADVSVPVASASAQRRVVATVGGDEARRVAPADQTLRVAPANPNAARVASTTRRRASPSVADRRGTGSDVGHERRPRAPSSPATANDSRRPGTASLPTTVSASVLAIRERERRTETPRHVKHTDRRQRAGSGAGDRAAGSQRHRADHGVNAARRNARSSSRRCRRPIAFGCPTDGAERLGLGGDAGDGGVGERRRSTAGRRAAAGPCPSRARGTRRSGRSAAASAPAADRPVRRGGGSSHAPARAAPDAAPPGGTRPARRRRSGRADPPTSSARRRRSPRPARRRPVSSTASTSSSFDGNQ